MRRRSAVVPHQNAILIGERAHNRDFRDRWIFSGSTPSFFSSTIDSFASLRASARCSALSSCFAIDFRVWHPVGRIEHAQLHPRREQAHQRRVHRALAEISLLHGFDIRLVIVIVIHLRHEVDALVVHAARQRDRRCLRLGRPVMMPCKNIDHRAAIGNHIPLKSPVLRAADLRAETGWRTPAVR